MASLALADILITSAYFLIIVDIRYWAAWCEKNENTDYFLAGRGSKPVRFKPRQQSGVSPNSCGINHFNMSVPSKPGIYELSKLGEA